MRLSSVRRWAGASSGVVITRRIVDLASDMAETPGEIHRALADPERLAIAGRLTRSDEKTVNVIVARFQEDYAAIRHYLGDEGFLARERGEYWRRGGRVDLG
jgi:hypothetical protein